MKVVQTIHYLLCNDRATLNLGGELADIEKQVRRQGAA
jgi:hypothetical protein